MFLTAVLVTAALATPNADLDSVATRLFRTGLSPGMSAAVVRGDRVVWQGAWGFADREAGRRVTPSTRFYIGSTTKTFTALAALRRAQRGQLDLDAPLSRAFPGLVLHAGLQPDSIRVRDLLTHTHGIDPMGPVSVRVAFTGEYTNAELLKALRLHPPGPDGRAFRYSNLGYDLVGILLAPKARGGWRDVVEREALRPLGMIATTAWRSRVPAKLLAMPYELGADGPERVPLAKEDANMGPAGGLFSTATDLAQVIIAELDQGRVPGAPGLDPGVVAATRVERVPQDRMSGEIHRVAWAYGWDVGVADGDTLYHRFGSFAGYRSHVSFLPEHGIGVVVLVNGGGGSPLADQVAAALYDRLRGRPEKDRATGLVRARAEAREGVAADAAKRAARGRSMRLPWAAFAGRYRNPDWGTIELHAQGDSLVARMGLARSAVQVYDRAKDQLRVELFGSGSVLTAEIAGDRVVALELAGARFIR
jgi:CubicO group peptidase (beta-lactamase class C family)